MTEPRIVDAEVIKEVPGSRPDLWIKVCNDYGSTVWVTTNAFTIKDAALSGFKGRSGFIVHIPAESGTAAPAPATATDAVEELVVMGYEVEVYRDSDEHKYFWCHVRTRLEMDVETERADSIQAAAAACLAKIRGAK